MALIIKSDQVTGSDFVPGVLQKLLLEKEKTGQERLQIKQFEFLEEIQFDFKTERVEVFKKGKLIKYNSKTVQNKKRAMLVFSA